MNQRHILIVDDDQEIRDVLKDLLEENYLVTLAATGQEALAKVRETDYDLMLLDVRLPDTDGLAVMQELFGLGKDIPVIVITGHGTSNTAIQAVQAGAYDYLVKPLELDEVEIVVRRLFEHRELASQVKQLQDALGKRDARDRIIGQSAPMQTVYKIIGRVAPSDATVLIAGETGTGKELVAETIHQNSRRRRGPLVKINCAALPETLLESELFGHEKGSFTGAVERRKGHFELADRGTIFLDEIGEMSPNTQKKFLRVLQEGEFQRVGGNTTIRVDVRVIAATNKNLEQEMLEGHFREDLYYRLNVINVYLPPLRERMDDLPLLVAHFLDKYRYAPSQPPSKISEEAMDVLRSYDWPGNVRELENVIERAVVLSQGRIIGPEHLIMTSAPRDCKIDITEQVRQEVPLAEVLARAEKQMMEEALRLAEGDVGKACVRLGLTLDDWTARAAMHGFVQPA
ncbi:MAG: sigma-54 dependent transcriptional regulator [Ardenticatenaceae bacterium]|nr:sigma-54 dependent transcriptional regulator [Ardenticatenaceae bacterium]